MVKRCDWGESPNPLYMDYHDKEWCVPSHDDRYLFELLILEGAQAGLSWSTIINKRENYREAFDDFDFNKIAKYDEKKFEELIDNPGIVRNKLKIRSTITNAQAFIKIREEFDSFDKYIWSFVDFKPIQNNWQKPSDWPAKTELSDKISKDLLKRGFKFVGSTIVYAYMQAIGMVNDHLVYCFRHSELKKL